MSLWPRQCICVLVLMGVFCLWLGRCVGIRHSLLAASKALQDKTLGVW